LENSELQRRVLLLALTLGRRALLFWVVACLLCLLALLVWILKAVHLVATLVAISTLLAYVIAPLVNYLSDRRGLNRIAAITLVYLALGILGGSALAYLIPVLHAQAVAFGGNFTGYVSELQHNLDAWLLTAQQSAPSFLRGPLQEIKVEEIQLEALARELQQSAPSWAGSTFVGVFSGVKAAAGVAAGAVLIPLFTFYVLMDSRRYTEAFVRLFPRRWKGDVKELLGEIDTVLGRYIRGQLLVCLTIGVSIAILLSLLGLPYAILVGVFAGIVDIIPYVGVAMGMVPAFLIALSYKGIFYAIFVVVMMEVVHWTEGHIVVPAIIGQSVGLPPLVVMIALGAGAELGGVTGMFLSMPVAAVLRVIVKFYVSRLEQAEEENSSASAEKFQLQEQEDMTLGKANGA
jgi:predicted PurR-regulated permease PerM